MKFWAISLIGLSFLTHQSQSQFPFNLFNGGLSPLNNGLNFGNGLNTNNGGFPSVTTLPPVNNFNSGLSISNLNNPLTSLNPSNNFNQLTNTNFPTTFPNNFGPNNSGFNNIGINNFESNNFGQTNSSPLNNFGTNNLGTNNFGSNNIGQNNFGTNNFGTNNFGINNSGSNNFGSNISGSNSFGSNQGSSLNNNIFTLRNIRRSIDGSNNNQNNPIWGATNTPINRLCNANYQDGISKVWQKLPQPRIVSNFVGSITQPFQPNRAGVNNLFAQWGQWLDHDITNTPEGDEEDNIPVPRCDKFLDKFCTGTKFFRFKRSKFDSTKKVRTNINRITHWIDASQVYGTQKQEADSIREFKQGKLKVSSGNLLPKDQKGNFFGGDQKVNQQVLLTVFHVLFTRQHNRLCDQIISKNSNLSDQQIYNIARNYVIGLVQHITYDEFLPFLIGKNNFDNMIGPYRYQPNTQPTIITQFSSAAYRFGHPVLNAPVKMMDNNGNILRQLQIGEMFQNQRLITSDNIDQFFNGMIRQTANQRTLQFSQDIRSFYFQPDELEIRIDIFSLNIKRNRDHGVCPLNVARQKMGLQRKNNFAELFQDQRKASLLQSLYQNIDNVQLYLAILGEPSVNGAVLGEMGIRLSALQFKNIRNADRFWYENYDPSIVKQIKATSFGDIIRRNTNVRIVNKETFKKL